MDRDLKQVLWIWAIAIIAGILVAAFIGYSVNADDRVPVTSCPDGTYQIGFDDDSQKPVCKNEPTGCVYGDSIPLSECVDKSTLPIITTVAPEPDPPYDPVYDSPDWQPSK